MKRRRTPVVGGGAGAASAPLPVRATRRSQGGATAAVAGEPLAVEPSQSQWRRAMQDLIDDRAARWALQGLVAIILACVVLPVVLPWKPTEVDMSLLAATPPSLAHPLGTDAIGRDQLVRLLSAGRVSLTVGLMVSLISVMVGAVVGTCAGYFGGRVDHGIMWIVTILMTIPGVPLLIALSVLVASPDSHFGAIVRTLPEQWRIIVVMSVLGWMGVSRVARAQVMVLRKQEYVEACAAMGGSHVRRMFLHVLPNLVPTLLVFATFGVSGAIMGESFLSFLGVGVAPPAATWGNMISASSDVATIVNEWWLIWTPAATILLTVLAINFVGEGLRSAVDPRTRHQR